MSALNLASLLLADNPTSPLNDCLEVTDLNQPIRPDMTDVSLAISDDVLFTDGISYIQDRSRYAGAMVVTQGKSNL